jgi:hypothetical protein
MKKAFFALGCFIAGAISALLVVGMSNQTMAQLPGGGVTVQGSVTPNNCVEWVNSSTIKDAGKTC